MLIFTCTEGQQGTTATIGGDAPTCASGGAWVEVHIAAAEDFDVADLDPAILTEAFGAGLVTLGIPLLIALAMRLIIQSVKEA